MTLSEFCVIIRDVFSQNYLSLIGAHKRFHQTGIWTGDWLLQQPHFILYLLFCCRYELSFWMSYLGQASTGGQMALTLS